jgi:DNA repair protein RadC
MRIYEARLSYNLISLGDDARLDRPQQVVDYLRDLFDESPLQELFVVILLDRKGHALGRHVCTVGTATSCLIHPREAFRAAIVAGATGVIASHAHPSGDPCPSAADLTVTRQLRQAAEVVGIDLIDHVVVGDIKADPAHKGYYSFREAGLL